MILRLYEACRTRGPVTLTFARPPASVTRSHLLEFDEGDALEVIDGAVTLDLTPFEIATLRVRF